MNINKIIKKITDDHIRLPSVARLKVTDMSYFLAYAKIPYYKVSRPEKGNIGSIWSERPGSLRHIQKNTADEYIRENFLAGRLELLDFRDDSPIPLGKANQFNPFILSIAFDEFVRYAKLRGVTVTVEDDVYFDRLSNDVFLKARDIAELVATDGGTAPTDEAILSEADSWVNECFMGAVIYETNDVDINNYASEQDAVLDNYVIELNSAIELAEILKKPTQRLKERLAQINLNAAPQQADDCLNAGADSQDGIEPTATKIIRANSNEIKFSGLLNIPGKVDDWFEVIDVMTNAFYKEKKLMPTKAQAWAQLWTIPPEGYAITTGKDRGDDCLHMPGVKSLSNSAFSKRWTKYTADKPQ